MGLGRGVDRRLGLSLLSEGQRWVHKKILGESDNLSEGIEPPSWRMAY